MWYTPHPPQKCWFKVQVSEMAQCAYCESKLHSGHFIEIPVAT